MTAVALTTACGAETERGSLARVDELHKPKRPVLDNYSFSTG